MNWAQAYADNARLVEDSDMIMKTGEHFRPPRRSCNHFWIYRNELFQCQSDEVGPDHRHFVVWPAPRLP